MSDIRVLYTTVRRRKNKNISPCNKNMEVLQAENVIFDFSDVDRDALITIASLGAQMRYQYLVRVGIIDPTNHIDVDTLF